MLAHFAADAVLHVPNMPPVAGEGAIRQFYGNVFRFLRASTPTVESARVAASGDVAYSVGSVANVFEGPQGAVEYAGKFSLVWENRAGEWSIVLYTISKNQPDPGR
jgi:ketosteroid isomerase-like protein